jgi:hypothetical protein
MKLKELYAFTLNKTVETPETTSEKDANGQEIKVTKNVKKEVPQKFVLVKPNREINDEADFFFAKTLSRYVREGLLTVDMLQKRISDDGGVLSKVEVKSYQELIDKINEIKLDYQAIVSSKKEEERTEDDKKNIKDLETKFKLFNEVKMEFENEKQALYEHTAEFKTRNQAIFWWGLFLAYFEDEKGKLQPYFSGDKYEDKLASYDELVYQEDEFTNRVIRRFMNLVTVWNTTGETSKEELDKSIDFLENEKQPTETKEKETKTS